MNAPEKAIEKAPRLISATVRVTRIRAKNSKGCIAFCHRVDLENGLNDRSKALVISASSAIIDVGSIEIGGIYEIYGESSTVQRVHDLRIPHHPATQSTLIWPGIPRPSGHLFHGHPAGQSERSDAGVALLVRVGWRRQFLRPFAH